MLHFDLHGGESGSDSPPLVLIHGSGGSRLHWPPEVRRMPQSTVYALDLPGHGQSPGPAVATIDGYVKAVLEWLETTLGGPAVFAGHSLGSAITLDLARQAPEWVAGIVLVGGGARLRVHPAILEQSSQEATFPAAVDQIMEWAFGPHAPTRLVQIARRRMLEVPHSVLNLDFKACNSFDRMSELELIETPALVLCGSLDQLTPPKYSEYLVDHLPDARLRIIPGAGHMVMLEQPRTVAAAITEFLSQLC
jgi:pimeloyl-ACP methyl ester carboxylesterase